MVILVVQPNFTYSFVENYIMVVGDINRNLFFLATNASDPLPSCLDGTKNPVLVNQTRNPAMMKTPGNNLFNSRQVYIANCL